MLGTTVDLKNEHTRPRLRRSAAGVGRTIRDKIVAGASLLALAACSSTAEPDYVAGIEWYVDSIAAASGDIDLDPFTGEIIIGSTSGLARSSGEGSVEAATERLRAGVGDAREEVCERYVNPQTSEPLTAQGELVSSLMEATVATGSAKIFSEELIAAERETELWLEQNGFGISSAPMTQVAINAAAERRATAEEQYWVDTYPQLLKQREKASSQVARLEEKVFSPDGVLRLQAEIAAYCDILIPKDFTFPTAELLGIRLE